MTASLAFPDSNETELRLLAEFLALAARRGDAIALSGELGAGKTAFARAFVRALLGEPDAEVQSPTFSLAQTYATPRVPVAHFDFYRLTSAEDAAELGFEEALARGIVLVEWPERASSLLPASRLDIRLGDGSGLDLRTITLLAHGDWSARLQRVHQVRSFCLAQNSDLSRSHVRYLQGDASPRAYARIISERASSILMNAPRMPDGPPVRGGLPYSRIAHLAEDVRPFAAIAGALRQRGLAAPQIKAMDLDAGLLLIEDLGDLTFGRALEEGYSQLELWRAAVDALIVLRRTGSPGPMHLSAAGEYTLPCYDRGALSIETELLLDWYWPALQGDEPPSAVRDQFATLWSVEFDKLLALPKGWVLRDYHSPNLMWMPGRQGIDRVGVLDFQDAVLGPWAFDLVSLLQDARVDVSRELEAELFDYYCQRVAAIEPDFDRTTFALAYALLGAQRNTKILGIFARLAMRDAKPGYLHHMPRIWGYLERNLGHSSLVPMRAWYDRYLPPGVRIGALSAA